MNDDLPLFFPRAHSSCEFSLRFSPSPANEKKRENSNPTLSSLLLIAMISMAILGMAKSQSNRYMDRQLRENHVKLMEGRLKMLTHQKKAKHTHTKHSVVEMKC